MNPKGEANGRAKLQEWQVREIRKRVADGAKRYRIAAAYGVSKVTVTDIVSGKTWGHVK